MNSIKLEGYVNSVGRDSKLIKESGKIFVEQIAPGVWEKALKRNNDIKLLLNHKADRELGSIKKGNFELIEDNIGLKIKCLINDPEVIKLSNENNLKGWSFGFSVLKDRWEKIDEVRYRRVVEDLELYEISLLTISPAYYGTSVEKREGNINMKYRSITNENLVYNKKNIFDVLNDFIDQNARVLEIDNIEISNETIKQNSKLISIVDEYGNFTDERFGYIGKITIDSKDNKLVVCGVDKIEAERELVTLQDVPEQLVEANGVKFLETLLKRELMQKVNIRIKKLFERDINKISSISNADDFITCMEEIPKPLRKGLVVVGNTLDIARLKLKFAKEGITDLLGLYPIELEQLDGVYLLNAQCLFINCHIKKVEYRKDWDVYDFKVVIECQEGIGNKEAATRINII